MAQPAGSPGKTMTNESDSTPRRRPPTIDLTAQEVDTAQASREAGEAAESAAGAAGPAPGASTGDAAKDGAAENVAPERSPGNSGRGAMPYVIGAVAGAVVVMVAAAGGFWIAGSVPARQAAVSSGTPVAAPSGGARDAEFSARLDKIEEALQTPHADSDQSARLAAADAQARALGEQLAALGRRVDEVAAASQGALSQAKAAAAGVEGAKSAAQAAQAAAGQRGDIDALNGRIAALDASVKSLAAELGKRTASADDRVARMTVAAEALRAAVERGAPYQAELAAVTSLGADPNISGPLAPFAADGVPGAAALGRELAALAPAMQRVAVPASADGSFLARLEAHAQNLVRVTPVDAQSAPSGDDAFSVMARINGEAARADIAGALADIARLPEPARALAADWVKKAQAREAAIAASRRIAADALAALNTPVSQ